MTSRNRQYSTRDVLNTPIGRGGILPFTEHADRSEFDLTSGLTGAIYDAFTAPARAYRGEISEDQMIPEAFNLAGSLTLGSFLSGAAAPAKQSAMAIYKGMGPQDAPADALRTARIAGADRFMFDDQATAFANKRPGAPTGDELLDTLRALGMGPANSNSATAALFANPKTGASVPLATRALEAQQPQGIHAFHDSPPAKSRAAMLGYSDEPFYRGEASGKLPSQYDAAFFSRDPEYAGGFARAGGQEAPREFRLNLENAFVDSNPVNATTYVRLAESVAHENKQAAADMIDMIAPGKDLAWAKKFAEYNPNFEVADSGALVRQMVDANVSSLAGAFKRAGFGAIDTGRDVFNLDGQGIRHVDAAFDPSKAASRDIFAGLLGPVLFGTLTNDDR